MIKNKLENAQKFLQIYNIVRGVLYICLICFASPFLIPLLSPRRPGDQIMAFLMIIFFVTIALGSMAYYFVLAYLAKKKSKVIYILEIINIILGLWDPIFMIPSVILLVLLIEPEVREYYMD